MPTRNAKLDQAAPAQGRRQSNDRRCDDRRVANPEDHLKLISLMPRADIPMTAETKEVTIAPGGSAEITVSIDAAGRFSRPRSRRGAQSAAPRARARRRPERRPDE